MKPNWIGRLQNIVHKGPTPVVTAKAMQWHAAASQSESPRAASIWFLLLLLLLLLYSVGSVPVTRPLPQTTRRRGNSNDGQPHFSPSCLGVASYRHHSTSCIVRTYLRTVSK